MIGKQFLAITTSIYKPNCINIVEVLSTSEEIYFDEDSFLQESSEGNNSPAIIINNQSKYLTFFCLDIKTRETFRICEYDIKYEITGCTKAQISKMIKQIELEIKATKLRHKEIEEQNKEFNEIDEDIQIHLENLRTLGYTGDDIKDRLQEFVDEKYPDLGLKIDIKKR